MISKKILVSGIIVMLLIVSGAIISFQFSKDSTTIYRDGEKLASVRWSLEAQRTYFALDSYYDKAVKCPRELAKGGRVTPAGETCKTGTRYYYPDNYFEQLSRSLINTKVYDEELVIKRDTPFYKYGTRGTYAGKVNEVFTFIETTKEEEFPESYVTTWNPKDTRNYKAILRLWNLKEQPLADGRYTDCKYYAKNIMIDLKSECSKLDYAEVTGDKLYFYFKPERDVQTFNIQIVDPVADYNKELGGTGELVGYWPLNGDATDHSGHGNDGSVTGATVTNDGRYGEAYVGEKNHDKIVISSATELRINETFTYSLWIKKNGDCFNPFCMPLVHKTGKGFIYQAETAIEFNLINSSDAGNRVRFSNPPINEWYHLVGRFNGTYQTIFVNGVQGDDEYFPNPRNHVNLETLYFLGLDTGYSFNGAIDEVRIYNRSLTQSEILELYNESKKSHSIELYASANQEDDIESANLVGWWKLDGDALDSSGNGNDGTPVNSPSITNNGKFKKSYSFDGVDQGISVPDVDGLDINISTISIWYREKSSAATHYLLDKWSGAGDQRSYIISVENSKPSIVFSADGITSKDVTATSAQEVGQWHHVVVRYNGSMVNMWVNGELQADNEDGVSGYSSVTAALKFAYDDFFDGSIDEVRIYNTSLSASQILQLYNQTKESHGIELYSSASEGLADDSELIAYWPLDGDASDESGLGNDGDITDAEFTNDGKFKGASIFDGSTNSIDIGAVDYGIENFSISVWAISNVAAGVHCIGPACNLGAQQWAIFCNGANWQMSLRNDTGNTFAVSYPITVGKWTHVVGTYDADKKNITMFIDGIYRNYIEFVGDFTPLTTIKIGSRAVGGIGYPFNGTIDEFRIYNKTLSQSEVSELYDESKTSHSLIELYGDPSKI